VTDHRLQPLLAPRTLALVGASPKAGTFGNSMIHACVDAGFAGDLYLVNPRYDEVEARACHPSLAELPGPLDHAVLNVANARLEPLFDEAIAAGVKAVTIFASGYLEGDGDPPLLARLKTKARAAGLQVCGGNGSGFYNRVDRVHCTLGGGDRGADEVGPVALISQSGSVYMGLLQNDGRLAFNLSVSSGQEIGTTAADYLDFALEMETTRVVGLFLETIRDPAGFIAATHKAAERDIPVVVVKSARTPASAAMAVSHSGALAGDDAVHDAVFEHCGVRRCDDMAEFIATLQIMSAPRRAAHGGLAAITDSGGEREHLADLAERACVPFAAIADATTAKLSARLDYGLDPVNPLDAWGTGHDYPAIFHDCMTALMDDPATGFGLWVADIRDGELFRTVFTQNAPQIAATTGKPMAFATCIPNGIAHETARALRLAGMPLIDGLSPAIAAIAHAFAWRDGRERATDPPPNPPATEVVARWRQRLQVDSPLDEAEGLDLLDDFGLPVIAHEIVDSAEAAVAAAGAFGYPVALKTAMAGIAHKSDVGGVRLGLADTDAVRAAWDDVADRLGPRCLVAPMAAPGVEMVFGLIRDAQFGPVVLVGAGGIFVEVLKDSRLALPPFGVAHARRLIDGLKARPLLDGARGRPAADVDALARALAAFSQLAATLGDLMDEADVNPIIAGPGGVLAVDALVVAKPVSTHHDKEESP
jgi:acetate---CoA ligase (ADP-forming)